MAQTGYTPILIYSSSTTSNVPTAGNLTNSAFGSELAINISDGKLFYKDALNNVQVIAWKVTPVSAGGTGLTSFSQGDLLYYDSGTTLTALPKNTSSKRYLSNTGTNNNPSWAQIDLAAGVSGVLPIANGGTNASSAGIGSFNNITGYSASGATGGTTSNIVFSSSPTLATPFCEGGLYAGAAAAGALFLRNLSSNNRLDSYNWPITTTYPLVINASKQEFRIGDVTKMTLQASGGFSVGTSSDPGADSLIVNGKLYVHTTTDPRPGNQDTNAAIFQNSANDGSWTQTLVSTGTGTNRGLAIAYTNASPNGTQNEFLYCRDSTTARFIANSNGGLQNYSANNVNLSDERVKKNITFCENYLEKICNIPVKNFLYKDQEDAQLNLGVIAQDVLKVAPEFVCTTGSMGTDENGDNYLTIYETDLFYALMKAVQELNSKVEDLKNNLNN